MLKRARSVRFPDTAKRFFLFLNFLEKIAGCCRQTTTIRTFNRPKAIRALYLFTLVVGNKNNVARLHQSLAKRTVRKTFRNAELDGFVRPRFDRGIKFGPDPHQPSLACKALLGIFSAHGNVIYPGHFQKARTLYFELWFFERNSKNRFQAVFFRQNPSSFILFQLLAKKRQEQSVDNGIFRESNQINKIAQAPPSLFQNAWRRNRLGFLLFGLFRRLRTKFLAPISGRRASPTFCLAAMPYSERFRSAAF